MVIEIVIIKWPKDKSPNKVLTNSINNIIKFHMNTYNKNVM